MAETLTVNGGSLASYLYKVTRLDGHIGNATFRGGDHETPQRPGATAGSRWLGPRVLSVEGLLWGDNSGTIDANSRGRYFDRYRALTALVWGNGAAYTITRVIPQASGSDLTAECTGHYLGGLESFDQIANHGARVAFDLQLLDPCWWSTSDTTLSTITTTLTPTITGDIATNRITLTFSGVTATQRLTNSTTGEYVEVAGNSGAATTLDCRDFTATRSGSSVAGSVASNGSYVNWLTLTPGSNSLTLTGGGQVIVAYRSAYL